MLDFHDFLPLKYRTHFISYNAPVIMLVVFLKFTDDSFSDLYFITDSKVLYLSCFN